MEKELQLYMGALAVDDRGTVRFVNDFNFEGVKRFYTLENHRAGFVRAWHGHKKEAKYVHCLRGAAVIGVVPVDDFDAPPDPGAGVSRYWLSAGQPRVLYIPPGNYNGSMALTDDTMLIFFSTSTVEESMGDDFRLPARFWDAWSIEER